MGNSLLKRSIELELYKLKHKRIVYKLMIIIGIAVLIGAIVNNIPRSILKFSMGNYVYTTLGVMTSFLVPFISFLLSADIVSGEEERDELKILFQRPLGRQHILFGKIFAIFIYLIILLIETLILSLICMLLTGRGRDVNFIRVILAYGISIISTLAICIISGSISCLFKSSSHAVFGMIVGYVIISLVGLIFPPVSNALFTTYLSIYKVVIGGNIPIRNLLMGIITLIGSTLIFASIGSIAIEKKEV